MGSVENEDFWIFGYGIDKVGLQEFDMEASATLWYGTDLYLQRDTEGDRVWGVAYHIVPSKVKEVKEYLDLREINGYSIQYTPFHPADPSLPDLQCLVYIGMPDNPQFLGALPPQEIAETINARIGPSGENRDYLLHLEQALNELSQDSGDEHVTDLARRVRALPPPARASSMPTLEHALKIVNSTEEQEEVEKEQ
ncbi:hypothetical protein ABEF95_000403 [Exophiala dermatitidis]